MINIHKRLWVIKGYKQEVEGSKALLSYMTHVEETKSTGLPSKAFDKRKETGTTWAKPHRRYDYKTKEYVEPPKDYEDTTLEFDNLAVEGFKIVGSVSRWTTANKLIRVDDPRGFVVEIPTGNLTTLLKYVTVEKGEVKDACVWGREGNNHILLPTSSEPYQKAFEQTELTKTKVSFTKLNKGDVVKFSVDNKEEYIYLGRGKATWEIQTRQASLQVSRGYGYGGGYYRNEDVDPVEDTSSVEDTKLCFLFKCITKDSYCYKNYEYKATGKAIVTGKQQPVEDKFNKFDAWLPDRCKPEDFCDTYSCNSTLGKYHTYKVSKVTMKQV